VVKFSVLAAVVAVSVKTGCVMVTMIVVITVMKIHRPVQEAVSYLITKQNAVLYLLINYTNS